MLIQNLGSKPVGLNGRHQFPSNQVVIFIARTKVSLLTSERFWTLALTWGIEELTSSLLIPLGASYKKDLVPDWQSYLSSLYHNEVGPDSSQYPFQP